MVNEVSLDFLISQKEKLDSWRDNYNKEYLKRLSDEEAREYNLMTTIKEENLLEKGKEYFGDISLKEIEARLKKEIKRRAKQKRDEYFDKVIPLKEQFDKDKRNTVILDQISMIFASYHTNVICITGTAMLRMIDTEIENRRIRSQKINVSCEHAIANLERRIVDPEEFMNDEIRRTNKLKSTTSRIVNKYGKAFEYTDDENNKDSQISDPENVLK